MTNKEDNVSRETHEHDHMKVNEPPFADIGTDFMQRIGNSGMSSLERLCSSAATLTDRVFLPMIVLCELQPGSDQIRNVTIHGPTSVPVDFYAKVLSTAARAIAAQAQQPGEDDPDQQTGDPVAAQRAMQEAMEQPDDPRANGADG